MANVIARLGRPALVLAPNKTLAAQLYSEFREFFPENAVEYFVSYYDYYQPEAYVPSRDLFIEKDSEHQRAHRADAPVGDQVAAGARGLGDRRHGVVHLRHRRSGRLPRHDPAPARGREAVAARHHRAPGGDAVRRATRSISGAAPSACAATCIDVFPAEHSETAIRITLFDDEVESLPVFDPLTGTRTPARAALHRVSVQPLRHAARDHAARDRGDQGGAARAHRVLRQRRTSWWRRSASSSARASTWRC